MSKVLFITANPKPVEKSVSLKLGFEFLQEYKKANPDDEIIKIDLYKSEFPELDYEVLDFHNGISVSDPHLQNKIHLLNELSDQFAEADKYVFVTPLWNLGLPPKAKTYIDVICVAGKTFRYSPTGARGLLENRKCLHIHASGGFHSKDPQSHADGYLKDIMSFMGVEEYNSLIVEGHNAVPDQAAEIIGSAEARIPEMVSWFS
ncbi:MAG: NAD(P)H-dependent oxidoreductase [Paludibacteraceae bacterium]